MTGLKTEGLHSRATREFQRLELWKKPRCDKVFKQMHIL